MGQLHCVESIVFLVMVQLELAHLGGCFSPFSTPPLPIKATFFNLILFLCFLFVPCTA